MICCFLTSSVCELISGALHHALLVILSAILLPIKSPVASAVFELLSLK